MLIFKLRTKYLATISTVGINDHKQKNLANALAFDGDNPYELNGKNNVFFFEKSLVTPDRCNPPF